MVNFFFLKHIANMHAEKLNKLINLNPYSLVIFTDNFQGINFYQTTLNSLRSQSSAINIDLNKTKQINYNRSSEISIFKNPRKSAIYIIIPSEEIKISDILDDIINISPASSRPKTLLFLQSRLNFDEKKILNKAWSLQFLDFSIIKKSVNNTFTKYNPFFENFTIKASKDVDELFPDKHKISTVIV